MTDPTPAQQLAVLADVLDAADPRHPEPDREAAAERAYQTHPQFAHASAVGLLHWLLHNIHNQYGDQVLADLIAQMRTCCAHIELWTETP